MSIIALSSRKSKQKPETWLRGLISDLDHGVLYTPRLGDPRPIHCNTNERVMSVLRREVEPDQPQYLERISNRKFQSHFSGDLTYYYAGNQRAKDPYTLVMIDIDVKKSAGLGSTEGAKAFVEHLKIKWPSLYYEPSTNGRGIHAYLVLDKMGMGAARINEILYDRLQSWLRREAQDYDIELVEVKGTLPVLYWGDQWGELSNYTAGTLAKFPRQIHRFEELKATTRLTAIDLQRLPTEFWSPERIAEIKPVERLTIRPKVNGSISGKVISEEELGRLDYYREVAKQLMDTHKINVAGKNRSVATVEDVAVFLLLGRFFTANMNADGSMPWERWRSLWTALYEVGDITCPYNERRFAAVRNYLDSLQLIHWTDNTYVIGIKIDGVKQGGRACKWQFCESLMDVLGVENTKEEEGRSPLSVTTIILFVSSVIRKRPEELIRPELDPDYYLWRPKPDDLDHLIFHFDYAQAA